MIQHRLNWQRRPRSMLWLALIVATIAIATPLLFRGSAANPFATSQQLVGELRSWDMAQRHGWLAMGSQRVLLELRGDMLGLSPTAGCRIQAWGAYQPLVARQNHTFVAELIEVGPCSLIGEAQPISVK